MHEQCLENDIRTDALTYWLKQHLQLIQPSP